HVPQAPMTGASNQRLWWATAGIASSRPTGTSDAGVRFRPGKQKQRKSLLRDRTSRMPASYTSRYNRRGDRGRWRGKVIRWDGAALFRFETDAPMFAGQSGTSW